MKTLTTICLLLTFSFAASTTIAQETKTNSDAVRIAAQKICPVSGLKLGEHGPPINAKVGEEEVFLCCKACLKGDVKPDHWKTMHQNLAAAQRICPVMENELPKKPEWTIVSGRLLFVCCPPCIDDIKADPDKFTKKVDALYAKSLESKKN